MVKYMIAWVNSVLASNAWHHDVSTCAGTLASFLHKVPLLKGPFYNDRLLRAWKSSNAALPESRHLCSCTGMQQCQASRGIPWGNPGRHISCGTTALRTSSQAPFYTTSLALGSDMIHISTLGCCKTWHRWKSMQVSKVMSGAPIVPSKTSARRANQSLYSN